MADMTLNEYMDEALRTAGDGDWMHYVLNGAMGLAGEAGEVVDHLKKHMFQGHELSADKLIEELGDALWYIACAAHGLGYTLEDVASRNIEKLRRRYPKGHFDREDSIRRRDEEATDAQVRQIHLREIWRVSEELGLYEVDGGEA